MQTSMLVSALFLVCLCNIAGAAFTVTSLFPTGGNGQVATFVATLTPTPGNLQNPKVTFTDQVGNGAVATIGSVGFTLVNGVAKATITKTYPTGPAFATGSVSHKIVATYPGQPAAKFTHIHYNGRTSTTVTLNKGSYVIGETIKITAAIKKVTGGGNFTASLAPLPANFAGIAFQHNGVTFQCKVQAKISTGWTCTYLIPLNEKTGSHKFTAIFQGIPAQKYGGSSGDATATIGCTANVLDCNNDKICESNIVNDVNHCGSCTACNLPNVLSQTCVNKVCTVGTCAVGFKSCNANPGCETNINTDPNNCGNCGVTCDLPNTATHTCKKGECQVDTCDATFGDCDCKVDGCETSLLTTTDCGKCGNPCSLPHATSTCVTGTCEISTCDAGFKSCTTAPGCETDTNNDVNNCGTCGNVCSSNHGTAKCNSGACAITCDAGYQDCAGGNNGCELDCSATPPTITYATTLAEYPGTATCTDALNALTAGGLPRFGSGNFNRNWVKATRSGIEIGLRAEQRRVLDITPTFNNIYETTACPSQGKDSELDDGGEARWNYGISINLKGGTGLLTGAKLGDFDIKLKFEPVGEKLSTFPIEIDIKDYLGGALLKGICDKCTPATPITVGTETITGTDCTALYSTSANKKKAVNALNILQESSNINFYDATFPFLETREYRVTLTLTHLTSSCVCPLQVEMIVLVRPPSPDPTKCPTLTCDQAGQIECDQDGKNGCETNSFTLTNCGGCGTACSPVHTPNPSCAAGTCTFSTCDANWASCDNIASNGCEYQQNTASTPVSDINIPQFVATAVCSDARTKLGSGLLPRVGSGNVDGEWVTSQVDGIIIGLRAEERGQGTYPVVEAGGFYTYESYACKAYSSKTTDTIKKARWNYGFSVDLSGFTGGGSLTLADFETKITITAQTPVPTGVDANTQSTVVLDVKDFGPALLGDVYGLANNNDPCLTFPFTVNGQQFATVQDLVAAQGGATDKLKLIQESTNIAFSPQFPFAATYNTVNVYDVTLTLTSKVNCAPKTLSVSIRVNVLADPVAACVGGNTCCNICSAPNCG